MNPQQIEQEIRRPIESLADWQQLPGSTAAGAKSAISARVPEEVSVWIYEQAAQLRVSPSKLIAQLLGEAIDARSAAAGQPRRQVIDLNVLQRFLADAAQAA